MASGWSWGQWASSGTGRIRSGPAAGRGRRRWLHVAVFDALGSTAALTDGAGAVSAAYAYAPYGEVVAASGSVVNPYRFAGAHGYHSDATTGLVKAGFRYLQPQVGRWTQPDPSGLEANAYLYAAGDPVNRVDATGLFSAALAVELAQWALSGAGLLNALHSGEVSAWAAGQAAGVMAQGICQVAGFAAFPVGLPFALTAGCAIVGEVVSIGVQHLAKTAN